MDNAPDSTYITTDDLQLAVEAALTLERPLLIKGEPGTGKTDMAFVIARRLAAPLHGWHIKSTTRAQQVLYEYDAVSRLRDSQLGDERVADIGNYIVKGVLWNAFESARRAVMLIDETVLPRMHSALLKNEQDIHLFERIIFLHKQQQNRH